MIVIYRVEDRVALLSIPDANKLGTGISLISLLWATYRILREVRVKEFSTMGTQYLIVALIGPFLMTLIPAKLLRRDKHVGDYWYFQLIALAAVVLAGAMANDGLSLALIGLYALSAVWSLTLFFPARTTGLVPPIPRRVGAESGDLAPVAAQPVELGRESRWGIPRVIGWTLLATVVAVPFYLVTPRSTFGPMEFGKQRIEVGYAAEQMIDLNRAGNLESNPEVAFEVDAVEDNGTPKDDLSLTQRWRGTVLVDYVRGSWRKPCAPLPHVKTTAQPFGPWSPPELGPTRYRLKFSVQPKVGAYVLADPVAWVPKESAPIAVEEGLGTTPRPWQVAPDGTFIPRATMMLTGTVMRYTQYTFPFPDADIGPAFELAVPLDLADPSKQNHLVNNPVPRVKEYGDELLDRLIREGKIPAGAGPRPAMVCPETPSASVRPPSITRSSRGRFARTSPVTRTSCTRRSCAARINPSTPWRSSCSCRASVTASALPPRSCCCCGRRASRPYSCWGSRGANIRRTGITSSAKNRHTPGWRRSLPAPLDRTHKRRADWHWLSLDPQPTADAIQNAANSGSWWQRTLAALDQYLLDYTAEKRNRILRSLGGLFTEPETYLVVAGAVALGLVVWRLRRRTPVVPKAPVHESWRWYTRLLEVLGPSGYVPRAGETPREFAATVRESLVPQRATAAHADVPVEWAEAYYQSRFSDHPIPDALRLSLEARLDELRRALNAKSSQGQP